tara:strand:- start:351 stop:566 length:216 start_codon:yes stop_codon:yes gene_type:complete
MIYKVSWFNHIFCETQTELVSSETELSDEDPRIKVLFEDNFCEDRPHVVYNGVYKLNIPEIESVNKVELND